MLNPKQKRFCEEYIVDLNATQAAIRAGYSKKTAHVIGFEHLSKPKIQEYISTLRAEQEKRTEITADMVVAELAKIGFANMQQYVNGGNNVLELKNLDSKVTAAVSKVKTTLKEDGSVITEIGLYDKVAALEKLGRHLGIFEKDNAQQQGEINPVVNITVLQSNDPED